MNIRNRHDVSQCATRILNIWARKSVALRVIKHDSECLVSDKPDILGGCISDTRGNGTEPVGDSLDSASTLENERGRVLGRVD